MAKKKKQRVAPVGAAHIKTTFNNTMITICDAVGNVICWSSAGVVGFKGKRKSTPYAAQVASRSAAATAMDLGLEKVAVFVKGLGNTREASIRALDAEGLYILSIEEKTGVPHNGCRPPKRRRL